MRKHRAALIVAALLFAGFVIVTVLVVRSVGVTVIKSGGTLVAGEFALTPLAVEETEAVGSESSKPGRSFYLIRIELENRSSATDFRFDPHHMLVRALDTGKAVRSRRGQRALGGDGSAVVAPGKQTVDEVVFEGPVGVHRMNIRFNLLGGPGELVNGIFGSSPSVELAITKKPS